MDEETSGGMLLAVSAIAIITGLLVLANQVLEKGDSSGDIQGVKDDDLDNGRYVKPSDIPVVWHDKTNQILRRKLNPTLARKVAETINYFDDKENRYFIVESGFRSDDEQKALYAQGRESLNYVNKLRSDAGMRTISGEENKRIITKSKPGESYHNYGLAVDVYEVIAVNGVAKKLKFDEKGFQDFFNKLNEKGGYSWGKSFGDLPHMVMKFETISQLKSRPKNSLSWL